MADGNAAVHAAGCLAATVAGVECLLHFAKVGHAFVNGTIACLLAGYCEKCFGVSHFVFVAFVVVLASGRVKVRTLMRVGDRGMSGKNGLPDIPF